jgi:hypothetical protein
MGFERLVYDSQDENDSQIIYWDYKVIRSFMGDDIK